MVARVDGGMAYPNLMPSYGRLLEPWGLKIMCVAAYNREKFTKTPILGVQGRSRSSMLVPRESSSAVHVSNKSVSICNRSHVRRANSGKITIS